MTDNLISAAKEQVAELTRKAYEKAAAAGVLPGGADIKAQVDIPKDVKNGDYATSFALAGAKALGRNPREVAQILLEHMDLEGSYFDKVVLTKAEELSKSCPGCRSRSLAEPGLFGQVP